MSDELATQAVTTKQTEGAAQAEAAQPAPTNPEPVLPFAWQQVQSAIWLIGLAVIAWQGWWWPGILVLSAISGLTQAAIGIYVKQREESQVSLAAGRSLAERRAAALPSNCGACGGALDAAAITWRTDTVAVCPWCTAPVPVTLKPEPSTARPAS